jgi:hypothetical protein
MRGESSDSESDSSARLSASESHSELELESNCECSCEEPAAAARVLARVIGGILSKDSLLNLDVGEYMEKTERIAGFQAEYMSRYLPLISHRQRS